MIQTVDNTIKSIEGEIEMKNKDMFKGFNMKAIEEHQKNMRMRSKNATVLTPWRNLPNTPKMNGQQL